MTGVHVLLDDQRVPPEECDEGPSVLSIALTNACDLECAFCYAPKTPHSLRSADVLHWCLEADAIGTLEVAFGGGEPTIYRPLPELCRNIWSTTGLGISITTHGHHLSRSLVDQLIGNVSVIRISIDGPEPIYSGVRGKSLDVLKRNLEHIRDRIPFGVNTVVNAQTILGLEEMAYLVADLGATDWLLLPEVNGGGFVLDAGSWRALDQFITTHSDQINLRVTSDASRFLTGPFLFANEPEHDYAHISADGLARSCSYTCGGVSLQETGLLRALRQLRDPQPVATPPTVA